MDRNSVFYDGIKLVGAGEVGVQETERHLYAVPWERWARVGIPWHGEEVQLEFAKIAQQRAFRAIATISSWWKWWATFQPGEVEQGCRRCALRRWRDFGHGARVSVGSSIDVFGKPEGSLFNQDGRNFGASLAIMSSLVIKQPR